MLKASWDPGKLEFVEQFKVLLLSRANRVLGIYEVSTGGISGTVAVCCAIYYLLAGINAVLGAAAGWATGAFVVALYLFSAWAAANSPDLPPDIDVENPNPLATWPAVKAGLHFMLPIGILIWCLMIEEMSPTIALSDTTERSNSTSTPFRSRMTPPESRRTALPLTDCAPMPSTRLRSATTW